MRASQGMNAYGLVWAGILLALPHATFVAATLVNSNKFYLNQSFAMGQSRVLVTEKQVDPVWTWFMPIFSRLDMASSYDGYVAGIGIRVCKGFFLANTRTIKKITVDEKQDDSPRPPGNFILRPYEKPYIEVSLENPDGYEWYPKHVQKIAPKIHLYYLARKTQDLKRVFDTNRITNLPRFDVSDEAPKNCKLVSLGNREREAESIIRYSTKRYVRYVDVDVQKCDGEDICTVKILGNGRLCGTFGELGAPIICGALNPLSPIKYIVHDWYYNNGLECYNTFKAVRMKKYADELTTTIAKNMNKETAVEHIGRPSLSTSSPYNWMWGTIKENGLPFMCGITRATT